MSNFITGYYNTAVSAAKNPDVLLVDSMLSAAPFLQHMAWTQANRQTQHIYREVADITGIDIIDFDSTLPRMEASFSLGHTHLTALGGILELGDDLTRQSGGADAVFQEQALLFAKEAGCKLEASYFTRILETAIGKDKAFQCIESKTPMPAVAVVTWQPGETCGLFSPIYSKVGERFFDMQKLSSGDIYLNKDGIAVRGAIIKICVGLLLANKRSYAALCNIPDDITPAKFAACMANVIDMASPTDNTTIIMPRSLKTRIASLYSQYGTSNSLMRFADNYEM